MNDDKYLAPYDKAVRGDYNPTPVARPENATSAQMTAWRAETMRNDYMARDKLRAELEKYHGFENHPKRNLLWNQAWDRGHSGGACEVVGEYNDLAEFLK